jgi:uncharacterized protein (DUF1015 family)
VTDHAAPLLRPVATRLVRPEWATRVVSPAYDAVRPERRRELMDSDPYVFLHVTRSPGDSVDPDTGRPIETHDEVTEANAAALDRLLAADVFTDVAPPGLYLYRLTKDDHVQTAIVGDIDLRGLDDGRIGPHERIRPQRATLLADHIERVGVHSSPVAFAYPDDPEVRSIVERASTGTPLLDFRRDDGLGQTIWRIPDTDVEALLAHFADRRLYIVDGHHRVAAGVEHRRRRGGDVDDAVVLGALFPAGELRVRPFHRRVVDTAGMDARDLAVAVAAADFGVRPLAADEDPAPPHAGTFGMYVESAWYEITPFHRHPAEFDATLLQERILGPILGVDEAGGGGRLEYLPGDSGLVQLVELVDADGGVGFALYPVSLGQLMAVVDRGQTLPPKSTYFEPKVRSGVFVAPR